MTFNDKFSLSSGQWLSDSHIDATNIILKELFSNINGFQSPLLAPVYDNKSKSWVITSKTFHKQNGISAQIHYNCRHHWLASVLTDSSNLFVLDSMIEGRNISASTEIQLAQIYSVDNFYLPEINQQQSGTECGLFAVANVVEFCHNPKSFIADLEASKISWSFNENLLRDHFISCLQNSKFTPFPKLVSNSNSPFQLRKEKIIRYCCGLPECFSDMIECESCHKWYHICCIEYDLGDATWYCNKCSI